ncbi:YdeI/OmpD-associated family protein [Persicirhabdus sediminis]|uniref:YdeI/OmpD-associated family protein n=1 Tax=Persicirhabdus sediminis TaxID=454144 RepID=A0A8J7SKT5_9BACT|nr:YdeI/OmpD-associated family protein [Persicirhabdus sediminis]MBK1789978.1 YdeI/OmpD-associated family protein [Persicirhabdus sediminis]
MPEPDPDKIISFKSSADLSLWLEQNHESENELWIKVFKVKTGIASVTWSDIVVEALCWGWIDGIKKSIDEQAYLQRITPRKAKSSWSKRNRSHVERLINEGKMHEPGLIHIRAAKADGRWDNAYATSEIEVPDDFIAALENKPSAKQFFQTLTKSNRYIIAHGLTSAKKPETRQRRFDKFMDKLSHQEKPS